MMGLSVIASFRFRVFRLSRTYYHLISIFGFSFIQFTSFILLLQRTLIQSNHFIQLTLLGLFSFLFDFISLFHILWLSIFFILPLFFCLISDCIDLLFRTFWLSIFLIRLCFHTLVIIRFAVFFIIFNNLLCLWIFVSLIEDIFVRKLLIWMEA